MGIERLVWPAAVLALGVSLSATAGCDGGGGAKAALGGPEPTRGGELVYETDFERGIPAEWSRGKGEDGKGQWRVEDGWVVAADIKNDPLWLDEPLPDDVRIEFDAMALSSVGDLKAEVFGDGVNHASGYVLIYGGWDNTLDVIARLDEHGQDRKSRETRVVVPNIAYEMAIERTNGTLHWFVNGEHFMSYDDPEPLAGEGHRHFALGNWSAPVKFDNVRVYDLSK